MGKNGVIASDSARPGACCSSPRCQTSLPSTMFGTGHEIWQIVRAQPVVHAGPQVCNASYLYSYSYRPEIRSRNRCAKDVAS
jgi:hypothetical protein